MSQSLVSMQDDVIKNNGYSATIDSCYSTAEKNNVDSFKNSEEMAFDQGNADTNVGCPQIIREKSDKKRVALYPSRDLPSVSAAYPIILSSCPTIGSSISSLNNPSNIDGEPLYQNDTYL